MEYKTLLQVIGDKVDEYSKEEMDFDIRELVRSYGVPEEAQPVVAQYVSEIHNLSLTTANKIDKDIEEMEEKVGDLGIVISAGVGTGIGALAGYLVGGSDWTKYCAESGAIVGFLVEMFTNPSAACLTYIHMSRRIKNYKKLKESYRNDVLSELEKL